MKKTLFALLIMGVIWPGLAVADQYRLIKGKNVPVCELCKKNLESFYNTSITCGRQYNPKLTDLKPVEWTKLDVMANKGLVRKIEQFAASGDQNAAGKTFRGSTDVEFEETLANDVRRQLLNLSVARADFDNDGEPEPILRYEGGLCPLTRGSAQMLYVLTTDEAAVDNKKTKHIQGWGWGTSVGIFVYQGRTYVDVWDDLDRTLTIFLHANGGLQDLCAIKYRKEGVKSSK